MTHVCIVQVCIVQVCHDAATFARQLKGSPAGIGCRAPSRFTACTGGLQACYQDRDALVQEPL
jgi:hypothetical protein